MDQDVFFSLDKGNQRVYFISQKKTCESTWHIQRYTFIFRSIYSWNRRDTVATSCIDDREPIRSISYIPHFFFFFFEAKSHVNRIFQFDVKT